MHTEHEDVTRVQLDGKEVILIGTAHISQESVEVVTQIIEEERPDVVCVELDAERFRAMREQQRWEELDLKQIIKDKQLLFLMARLALTSFQKRMGSYTGVKPGAEQNAAVDAAYAIGAQVVLCDRDVRQTLLRAWRMTPLWKRTGLAGTLVLGMFERTEVDEEQLAELREQNNISNILAEMGEILPEVKTVLVDERDLYMTHEIQNTPGEKVVVVIGAAHKPGITRRLPSVVPEAAKEDVTVVPERGVASKALPWVLPLIILGIFAFGFYVGDTDKLRTAALAWILVNGVLCAIGAAVALAHPLTVLIAFLAAPITSLNPTIGAGMVTAFVQTILTPPRVKDMEGVGDDILEWRGWWTNRLARVMLVFVFSTMGSAAGTFISFKWLYELLNLSA
ncbi:MAG: TraB/GumN family protein [Myxococcota bacterium]